MIKRIKAYMARLAGPGLLALGLALGASTGANAASVHVTGNVTNQSGTGVQNVSVTATAPGATPVDYGPSFTEADGSYTLDVDPGTYDFHFMPAAGSGLNPVVYSNFTVMTDQVLNIQTTPIIHEYTLSGVVRDTNGSPIAGAKLYYNVPDNSIGGSGTSDANGNYSMTLSAGIYSLVQIGYGNFNYSPSDGNTGISYDLTTDNAVAADVLLPPMATINIEVRKANGNLAINEPVLFAPTSAATTFVIGSTTISASGWVNSGVPNDNFHPSTGANGVATLLVPKGTSFSQQSGAELTPGNICVINAANTVSCLAQPLIVASDTSLTLALKATHILSGVVRDAAGNPKAGVELTYNVADNSIGGTATSDANGHYSLLLSPGTYSFVQMRYGNFHFYPTTGSTGITHDMSSYDVVVPDVYLPEYANIDVLVRDVSGLPLANAPVRFAPTSVATEFKIGSTTIAGTGYSSSVSANSRTTGIDGLARLIAPIGTVFNQQSGQTSAEGNICTSDQAGSNVCMQAPFTLTGDRVVELMVAPTHNLTGTVRDATGNPIAGVAVSYNVADNSIGGTRTTDSNGQYAMDLSSGTYSLVQVSRNGFSYYSPSFAHMGPNHNLANGDVTAPDIILPPTSEMKVVVQDVGGSPVADASVSYDMSQISSTLNVGSVSYAVGGNYTNAQAYSGSTDAAGISRFEVPITTSFSQQYGPLDRRGNVCFRPNQGNPVCLPGPLDVNVNTTIVFQAQPATPDAPTGLSASTPTINAPALTWNATSGATTYRIFRDGTQVGTTTDPNFVDTALAASGSYSYTVQSVNADNVASAASSPFVVVYDATAPTLNNVSVSPASIITGATATLSAAVADALTDVAAAEYFEGTDPGQGSGTAMTLASGSATATVGSSLTAGVHTLKVRAQDGVGNWSTPVSVQLTVKLAAPTNLQAASPTNNPVLTWTAASGAHHYDVYRDGVKVGTVTSTTYTDAAANTGSHTYYVRALTAADLASDPSTTITVVVDKTKPTITYAISPAPNAAGWNGRATVAPVNTGNVTVTFTCGDGTGGTIQSCTTPQTVTIDGNNRTVTGTATDAAGNTTSVTATVKLDRVVPTAGPLSWTQNPLARGSNTTFTVTASDALSGLASGEYFVGTDPGTGNATALTLGTGQLTATFGSTLAAGTYTVGARSRDAAGNWSTTVTGQLVVTLPAPVITGGPQLIVTNRRPTITWNAVPGAATYRVYRNGTLITGTNITGTTYTDNAGTSTNPNGATTYRYNVVAMTAAGGVGPQSANYLIGVLPAGNTLNVTGNVLPVAPGDVLPNFTTGRQANFTFRASNQNNIMQPTAFSFIYGTGATGYSVNASSLQWVTVDPSGLSATIQGLANTRVGNGAVTSRAFRLTLNLGDPQHFKLDVFNSTSFTTVQYHVDRANAGDVITYQ